MNNILSEIVDNWKLEGKDENNPRYFYHTTELDRILKGQKFFVIGRKGTGKTALREFIYQSGNAERNTYTEKLTFKNFPFGTLYQAKNTQYTPPNQYITLWKLLIYSVVAKMMLRNKGIDQAVKESLDLSYKPDTLTTLTRVVPEWLSDKFCVLPTESAANRQYEDKINWTANVEILEDIIMKHLDDSKYFIIFDELDEDYRDQSNIEDYTLYKNLITSLFKAVQDVNSTFRGTEKKIFPIIFLRDDIYAIIQDADKNKWNDSLIEIEWDREKIQKLLAFRISRANEEAGKILSFTDAWNLIFTRGKDWDARYSFEFISRSTHMRPRDFVFYIQKCAEDTLAFNSSFTRIGSTTVKRVDKSFSNYLKKEITDEIFPILPDIQEIYQVLIEIRKPIFTIKDFKETYDRYVELGTIKQPNTNFVLQTLFDFSVIGNQRKDLRDPGKLKEFFRYKNKEARINFNEGLCVHRGLHKSLQILP